jgi:hypothetical protein
LESGETDDLAAGFGVVDKDLAGLIGDRQSRGFFIVVEGHRRGITESAMNQAHPDGFNRMRSGPQAPGLPFA